MCSIYSYVVVFALRFQDIHSENLHALNFDH